MSGTRGKKKIAKCKHRMISRRDILCIRFRPNHTDEPRFVSTLFSGQCDFPGCLILFMLSLATHGGIRSCPSNCNLKSFGLVILTAGIAMVAIKQSGRRGRISIWVARALDIRTMRLETDNGSNPICIDDFKISSLLNQ